LNYPDSASKIYNCLWKNLLKLCQNF